MQPKVSVIIPTYNRAHFLPYTLKSVFSQDYENLEIIVVDDGSTDGTREYLSTLPNVNYISFGKHRGQCSTRNAGLDSATGKYILMLDDDDALIPGIIKKHVNFLESHPQFDLVFGDLLLSNTHVINNPSIKESPGFKPDIRKGTEIDFDMKKTLLKNLKSKLNPKKSILFFYTPKNDYLKISTGTALFRQNKVRYDLKIEENWNCSADVDFWGQLIMAEIRFAYLPGLALECRIHSQNLTNQAGVETKTRYDVRKYIYNKLKCHLKK